jgi:hypothetical protein
MSTGPDSPDMHRFPFGDDVADRLLSGSLPANAAPESYRSVAALFEAATGPATSAELARAGAFAATAAAAVLETVPPTPGSRRVLKKLMTAKAAAVATTLAFGLGTAAAAATGSLPGQSGHANSNAAPGLAIATSHQSGHSGRPTTSSVTIGTTGTSSPTAPKTRTSGSSIPATGPANQNAQFGLCTAFLNGQKHVTTSSSPTSQPPQYSSTAFQALIAQNGSVAATTTYCQHLVATTHQTTSPSEPAKPANPGNSTTHTTDHTTTQTTDHAGGHTGVQPAGTGRPASVTTGPPSSVPGKGSSH